MLKASLKPAFIFHVNEMGRPFRLSATGSSGQLRKSEKFDESLVKAKYVIIKHDGKEVPLVFSAFLQHDDVAAKKKVISAGFCKLDGTGKWAVGGHSVSLKLGARPQDAEILDAHL